MDCLRLSAPALIIGLVLRLSYLAAIPEARYSDDAGSYFVPARDVWTKGEYRFPLKRRWLYPITLIAAPVLPGSTAQTVAYSQHFLGLAAVLTAGWIVGNVTQRRKLWVPLATVLVAVMPQPFYFEHEAVAETLFVSLFMLTVALAFPTGSLRDRRRLLWFLLAAAAVAATKPHGRPIWLGCLGVALFYIPNPLKWGPWNWGAVAAGMALILTSGERKQGAWLFLASTLPFVNIEGESWSEYRAELAPLIREARSALDQYPWRQSSYKVRLSKSDPGAVSPVWGALAEDDEKYSEVCSHLAKEAVLTHPIGFFRLVLGKIALGAVSPPVGDRMVPKVHWAVQTQKDQGRWAKESRVAEMELYYGWKAAENAEKVAKRSQRTTWLAGPTNWLCRTLTCFRSMEDLASKRFSLWLTPYGFWALLGIAACCWRRNWQAGMILLGPTLLYLFAIYAVGDSLPRYFLPVEWLTPVIGVLALESLWFGAVVVISRLKTGKPLVPQVASAKA